ncbi:protein MAIN-LIKE 2-like [Vicia villosa]|uniref:protein MAIN-LIKE 2-like n=1 Tax=Vicia villosa TaxID=3911 RepID=UPI00273C3217|nr:protein MAIN-LIKE 2-like [Vicia villosa]
MDDTIIEAREELMLSPSSNVNQTLRTAYFLKPSIQHSHFLPPKVSISSETTTKLPLEIRYNGWRPPTEEWKKWVKKLQPKFEYLWIQAGIYQAIKASTYEIKRDDDLILELVNRWCSETSTFVFPWGESTITLEDTKVCFGYSLLGCSVSNPLVNSDQVKVEEELMEARRMFNSTKAKKVTQRAWMMYFMETESKVEHEAFLVYWLSRFVFPADAYEIILKSVVPVAIHLAHGNRIALAPAVLASVYRDLSLLNSVVTKNVTTSMKSLGVTIWSPFQLVQIWALERFLALKPRPYIIGHGLPKVARWGGVKVLKSKYWKKDLDIAGFGNGFLWQPYENSPFVEVCNEKDMWKCDNPGLAEEIVSRGRCLRACELVGMGCKEKYFPHRVAMQFGMDQDIPGNVAFCEKDSWVSYSQPVALVDIDLIIQLCSSKPGVTSRYYDWWKQSKSSEERDNKRVKVEKHRIEGSDKDHVSIYELSSSDSEVVENGKALSSNEFGDFTSSTVGDEAEINSQCCDKNGEKEESVNHFTIDKEFDLENRIEKLERVMSKLKEARFGNKYVISMKVLKDYRNMEVNEVSEFDVIKT